MKDSDRVLLEIDRTNFIMRYKVFMELKTIFIEKNTIQNRDEVQILQRRIYFRIVIEADLYRKGYSLDDECHSYKKECNTEMMNFIYYKEEYYSRWVSIILSEKDATVMIDISKMQHREGTRV